MERQDDGAVRATYEASHALLLACADRHQQMLDFCYGLRWLMRQGEGAGIHVEGISSLITHLEELRQIATSYHIVMGTLVAHHQQGEEKRQGDGL